MLLLLPVLLPVIGGVFVFRQKSEQARERLALALILGTAALALVVCLLPEQRLDLPTIQSGLHLAMRNDSLAKLFLVLVCCIWVPVLIFSFPYIRHAGGERSFMTVYTMTLGVLAGLAMAANFVTMYMFFEMMSLITVPMVLHNGTSAARRAGFKYLGYSVFGAGMALAGYFFIAYYMAAPDFAPGGAIDPVRAAQHRPLLLVIYCLMIVGFGAKAGMVPMQAWLPAAHPVAPAPASAVLSGVITKGGVLAVIRVTYYMFGVNFLQGSWPQYVLLTLALATVFVGSMLAYREKLLKRRLAYSTVSQVSYVLFGLLLLTPEGVQASLLQMVFHALAKDALFLGAGAIIFSTNYLRVDQLRGIGKRMPVTMMCFTLAALSLIGIPPMAGAVSKWYLVSAGLSAPLRGFGIAGLVVLIVSALLTAGYLLPIVTNGFFPGKHFIAERKEMGPQMTGPLIAFAAACLLLGLFPGGLLQWLGQLAGQLFA